MRGLVHPRRLILLPGLALLIASLLAAGTPNPPARATASLPSCRYLDIVTAFRGPTDWQRTLVDTTFMVPKTYAPADLVPVARAGISGDGLVRELVLPDLAAIASAAEAAGTPIAVQSAYRSYAYQASTFSSWVGQYGYGSALVGSARPGHSEHQLGTSIDFMSAGGGAPWDQADWAKTPAGAWMAANAWRFGFVMSYPKDERATTCYGYEPWHYRYVGRAAAAAIHDDQVTIREYLWYALGNSVMAPSPTPATPSSPTPAPTPTAQASAALEPAASATAEGGVAGVRGGPDAIGGSAAISLAGIVLATAIGLAILGLAEELDHLLRSRWRRPRRRPIRRRRGWAPQARRSSSLPSP